MHLLFMAAAVLLSAPTFAAAFGVHTPVFVPKVNFVVALMKESRERRMMAARKSVRTMAES
jgi:hypothetical protein